jgi:phosphoribosylformylglycinamidine (FGAM) synthase PurS component
MPRVIARVIVTPKPVVNDTQGITVRQGMSALGFAEVSNIEDLRFEIYMDGHHKK